MSLIKSVAVIGTGPSGAIAVDALMQEKVFDRVRVFERQEKAGGCWVSREHEKHVPLDVDKLSARTADVPIPIPSNLPAFTPALTQHRFTDSHIYPNLHTNVDASTMEYSQEPIPAIRSELSINLHGPDTPFRHHTVIRQFVEDLLNRNGYQDLVEYNTTVERAVKDPQTEKWVLTLRRASQSSMQDYWWSETFDALVVASGHFSVPYVPAIPGLAEFIQKYPENVLHTKQYRGPERYHGKKVVTVGASVSAADTAVSLIGSAQSPIYSVVRGRYNPYFGDWAFRHPSIKRQPSIARISSENGERTVYFEDGTSVSDVDYIILGTGFTWTLPYLPDIPTRNNRVPDLYLHVFHQNDPSLVFVGGVGAGLTFKIFEWQAVAAARVLAGKAQLPSVEEQRKWEQDRIAVKGDGPAFTTINPDFPEYFETLRQLAGEPKEGEPGRRLPPFEAEWMDVFNAGHERRIRMWQKANEAAVNSPSSNERNAHFSLAFYTLALPLAAAKSLWSDSPGNYSSIITTAFPLGNGRLGADALPGIREWIFQNGTGNVSALLGEFPYYGSYQVLANLTIDMDGLSNINGYRRSLDLESAIYSDHFSTGDKYIEREAFCSYPDNVCAYRLTITFGLENQLTCHGNSISLYGRTYPSIGMIYNARVTIVLPGSNNSSDFCSSSTVKVPEGEKEVFLVFTAGTNYNTTNGNTEAGFSFQGEDPYITVLKTATAAAKKSYSDFQDIFGKFTLNLPDPNGSADQPTTELLSSYTQPGDPYVENLLFDFGRYLFIASSRPGSLPPNLQGLWTEAYSPAWSGDYHANINLQMNHWAVDQTGLGEQTEPLWSYIAETWLPRGAETAELLYGTSEGWVTHDEMNTFGHTAMKNVAQWADYPATNAWLSHHVWDHFDYSQDVSWYRKTGYPILKGTAQFWLSQLVQDEYFRDGTLVVNPCNSPEHGPTTFGCTHYQQLIWEVFDHVLRGWEASGDDDASFKAAISSQFSTLDPGIHIGSWGQIQEWKLDIDVKNDTHRHLSNLYGWYPGHAISAVHGFNKTITDAVETTLYSRGTGVEDSNTGWGKVWRSACWGLLNNTDEAYSELSLAIQDNFADNGLDLYGGSPPFQIDANFGLVGAMIQMLVRDLDGASADTGVQRVLLGPAIPAAWGGGSAEGLRLRGGGMVQFHWDDDGVVDSCRVDVSGRGSNQNQASRLEFFVRGGHALQCSGEVRDSLAT
ncbi:FAD/NAD(P)-binding domain-containing protein [Aspergillus sclerotioniger CBS 115572]|uniref:FAD/NAD(P)-binding domain-containing protein n=1 Tax=Aspergillus sclerotioniger CBS 115572 TaxID=1450535 RepID=A0A317X206_9EURO|nr:FAD/NAD(P)-binding domain-containing protein [Aspergillus sclerotioniger CBS 115572]PWY91587.1 FAD/NAD(P)-binding domain-containing protein [Aspergillus sclerotioniger CBS 115572]